nr:hypothetical protein [Tanacetum cinerariifolium]
MDSIISPGQKNTLAEYMILSGDDNHPHMLDKDLYDSWKSRMELYMQNREHGRMILKSVEHSPLIWPTVEENGVIRTKKFAELSAAEKIQADCDMKATNIILQGLPADIYSLVNHHRVAKDLWERVQLLMQGTCLTKQERECKLLPPEWSKFVTDVKLVKYFHTSNYDQLHAYLEQHELHANEVRLMRECNQDQLAFVANQKMTPPYFNTYKSSYNNPQPQQQFSPSQHGLIQPNQHYSSHYPSQTQFNHSSIPPSHTFQSQMNHQTSTVPQVAYQSPQTPTQLMTGSPFVDSGFAVLVFLLEMIRLLTAGLQCNKFRGDKDKIILVLRIRAVLLVQGEILQVDMQELLNATTAKEQLAFLADLGILANQAQTIIPHNAAFQIEDLDTYDSDCDDLSTAQAVLVANISNYGSDVISESEFPPLISSIPSSHLILALDFVRFSADCQHGIMGLVNYTWEGSRGTWGCEGMDLVLVRYRELPGYEGAMVCGIGREFQLGLL